MIETINVIGALVASLVFVFSYFLFPYWMINRSLKKNDCDLDG